MYFPQRPIEFREFLRNIESYSDEQKLSIIEDAIRHLKNSRFPFKMVSYSDINSILNRYKEILIRQQKEGLKRIMEDLAYDDKYVKANYKEIIIRQQKDIINRVNALADDDEEIKESLNDLKEKLNRECEHFLMIVSDVKSYKNLFIFILSHPLNNSNVIAEILSRINYLDKMTREVTFVMPGYKRAGNSDKICNVSDPNLQLTFDENIFIDIVQDLENKSNGRFIYNDECELLIVGMTTDEKYDFGNYVRLNLNELAHIKHVDAVRLIMSIAHNFRVNNNRHINVKEQIYRILGHLIGRNFKPIIKFFIAGSKKLNVERALLREELSKIENTRNLDIRSLTFEDFATSLTGKDRGRQADYNKFIEKEADVVVFIFDSTAGEITEEEFNIAYESFLKTGKPNIFVYVRKRNYIFEFFMNSRLRDIRNKVFNYHQEYYIEYRNHDDLRYKFYSDIFTYFESNKAT